MTSRTLAALLVGSICLAFPAQAAQAADADKSATQLEEIVVTAERTNRTVQDTATSVMALTGKDVAQTPAQGTYDIIAQIPNLVATRSSNNGPAIRGIDGGGPAIGANAFFAGTRPRVNFLVDGRTLTFNEAIYLDAGIWDLQQIEVYRGPQSTLQGRNSVGGVIAIKTADPTFQWQGKARSIIGEDNVRQISGAVGGPLVDDLLAFRVSADYRRENAYVKTAPYAELAHPGRYKALNLRGKLLVAPSAAPDFRSLTTVSYTDAYAPQTLSVKQPYKDYISSAQFTPRFRTRATVGINDTTWQLSDAVGLSAFLTATDFRINRYVNAGNGIAQIDGTELTAEPRLHLGNPKGALSGFLAGYIFHSQQDEAIDLFGGGTFNDKTLTKALFGEFTYKPAALIDITMGTRYEEEDRDRVGGAGVFLIDFHKTFRAFLPRATISLHPLQGMTVGATVGRGYNAGGAGFAFNPPFPSFTYGKETVWNYETFVRSALFDDRLQLNANVFFNDYSGLQLPFDVAQDPSAPATIIRNAERATTYGAEVEAKFRATTGVNLTASAGLLKTKVNRYDDPSIEGNELSRSPAFSFAAGIAATPLRHVDASFSLHYTDAYFSDEFNNARGRTDPYFLADAQLGYTYRQARIFIAVTNLFDANDFLTRTVGRTPDADIANMTRPRRVSGGVEFSF